MTKIFIQFLTFATCLFLSFAAYANTVLFVSPTRVNLDERRKVEVMNLSNLSDVPRHYIISVEEYAMNEKGVTGPKPDFPFSAKKMIRFFPREVTIQPGERQAVRVMAKIPADTPDGQYHAHIKFFEDGKVPEKDMQEFRDKQKNSNANENKSEVRVTMTYSALMPIIITRGKIDTQIDWAEHAISWDDKIKSYKIDMKLLRSGNGQGVAYADVLYIPPGGGEPVQLGNRRTFYIYREIDKRDGQILFTLPEGKSGGQIKLRLLQGLHKEKPVPLKETVLAIP